MKKQYIQEVVLDIYGFVFLFNYFLSFGFSIFLNRRTMAGVKKAFIWIIVQLLILPDINDVERTGRRKCQAKTVCHLSFLRIA